jgi:hypothetical protein
MLYLGIDRLAWQIAVSRRDENGDVKRSICVRRSARPKRRALDASVVDHLIRPPGMMMIRRHFMMN